MGTIVVIAFALSPAMRSHAAQGAAPPAKIIVLRHGEKQDAFRLCSVGVQRSLALAAQYLGKNSANSLFAEKDPPAAFFAITPHTLELVAPAAASWNKPVITYAVVPLPRQTAAEEVLALNQRTQEAARDVMTNPRWKGKTVVMVWEHPHIAKKKLEEQFPGQKVTLRQLLNLDKLKNVPKDWPGDNYDYFWIVEYGRQGSNIPTGFQAQKQVFAAPYQSVPANDWGQPEQLPPGSGCVH